MLWSPRPGRMHCRALVLVIVSFGGCAPLPRSLPADWDIYLGEADGTPLTQSVVIIADTQIHNLYADPVELRRTGLANRLVNVAIRPVQLDLYGLAFLDYLAGPHGDGRSEP